MATPCSALAWKSEINSLSANHDIIKLCWWSWIMILNGHTMHCTLGNLRLTPWVLIMTLMHFQLLFGPPLFTYRYSENRVPFRILTHWVPVLLMKLNHYNDSRFILLIERPIIQAPACLCLQGKIWSRSTAFLGALPAHCAESAPRKAVDSVSNSAF